MKIAKILKTVAKTEIDAPPKKAWPSYVESEAKTSPPTEEKRTEDVPRVNRQEVESEVRERVQAEFHLKLKQVQEEVETNFRKKIKEEEMRARERELQMAEQQKYLQQTVENLKNMNAQLQEQSIQKREHEVSEPLSSGKGLEEAQKKIRDLHEKMEVQEKAAEAKEYEWQERIRMEKVKRDKLQSLQIQESASVPRTETPRSPEQDFGDIEKLYSEFLNFAKQFFDQVIKGQVLDLTPLKAALEKLMAMMPEYQSQMTSIAQVAYEIDDHFAHNAVNCLFLALILGSDFNLSKSQKEDLALAAFFHDIALVQIQEKLDYPKPLKSKIKGEMLEHANKSTEIMEPYLSQEALAGIGQHHEAENGQGYPSGIRGDEISVIGKIIHLVDAFEAMTHARPYRPQPMPVNQAVKGLLESGKGVYDKQVLKSLMVRIGLYPVRSLVELSNKQIGKVLQQNRDFPLSPIVQIEYDEFGHKLKRPLIVDLSESRLIHITGPLEEMQSYQARDIASRKTRHSRWKWVKETVPAIIAIALLTVLVYFILRL